MADSSLFNADALTPHGFCLLWQPGLIWLNVLSDSLTALAYFSIPVALLVFVAKRRDLAFSWMFVLFGLFIMACGATHLMDIWTLWHPDYLLQVGIKVVTAIASIITALSLWPLIPKALALPSPVELRKVNEQLQRESVERGRIEDILRQAQKMESVGQLTGGIAHDFNNMLGAILGSVERLQRRLPTGTGDLRVIADDAIAGVERAAKLTHRLLAFARQQPLSPKSLDLNKLVAGISDLLGRTLGENVVIETVLAGGLWRLFADTNQLESALLNLAVNARDAMSGDGKLTIETGNVQLDAAYAANQQDLRPGDYVMLAVTDTGTGMTKDIVEKVFDPFFTTKAVGQGTGLGLSQVYGFIKQSGGHVQIYSEPGEGTTVKLYLPRQMADHAVEDDHIVEKPVSTAAAAGQTILVVEDDDALRAQAVGSLKDLGYRVLEAENAQRATHWLSFDPAIQLLFTDVVLPGGVSGRQLADDAQQRNPRLKVLFTTGYARNAIVHQGRLDPGVELLTKPYSCAALAEKVRGILEFDGVN